MRAVVTVLRARSANVDRAAQATVEYVTGPGREQTGQSPGAVAYYADQTPEGPGRWLGAGGRRFGLSGAVDADALGALLRGEDPTSGAALLSTQGSTRRARTQAPPRIEGASWSQESFTMNEAAALLGVSDRYLRRVAGRTHRLLAQTGGDASTLALLHGTGRAFLVAEQGDDAKWRVTHAELERFAAARRDASVVIGYDVTFTVPKSVSIVWGLGDAEVREAIVDALDTAVTTGFAYLERQAAFTGRRFARSRVRGLTAAAFTHATSRRLDPHLHAHVVIANVVERPDGEHRTLAGAGLFEHAKTAGYLAGAQLRNELSARLGLRWRSVASGIFEIEGIARPAIDAVSTRAREIDDLADARGVTSTLGRRAAAQDTRAPKVATDLGALRQEWEQRLQAAGLDVDALTSGWRPSDSPAPLDDRGVRRLSDQLLRHDGLTARSAVFTRGEVIQAVADSTGDRVNADGVEALADRVLADPRVMRLAPAPDDVPRWTTRLVVECEAKILRASQALAPAGRPIDVESIGRVAATELTPAQLEAVVALCRNRGALRCLVGAAGTGKTHTLRSAADVWRANGLRAIGAAVLGTAAEHLEHAADIPTRTVAGLLHAIDATGPHEVLDAATVLIVDEASTVGTVDLARLVDATRVAGATLVLSGDPAQHQSVAAGGAFAMVVRSRPGRVVALTDSVRQAGPAMATVRDAVDELRTRETDHALHRLLVDGRIQESPNREQALDRIVQDWANDRNATPGGATRSVCMISEDHRTRRALIERARLHLASVGVLHGPCLRIGDQEFRAGDEVIARAPARHLHPPEHARAHVRNGTTGTVISTSGVTGKPLGLWVEFDGRGPIFVPAEDLAREIRPGIVGVLTHSYALTSHAAQGATFDVARTVATSRTSPAGLYVAATRGREDLRIYTTAAPTPDTDEHPVVRDSDPALAVLARSLRRHGDDVCAIERDPTLLVRVAGRASPSEPEATPAPSDATALAPPLHP